MTPLIDVVDLVKIYPGGVRAVDGISFTVGEGRIFGFLGPNGAGKTTTIRIIVTLIEATSGLVSVDGIDVRSDPEAVRRRVGYAAQFIGIDDDLSGRENLVLQGRLHGLSAKVAKARSDALLEVLQLTDAANRRAGTYSGGMRRRLDLGQSLVHEPKLLVLDEPTTGLDPATRRGLWEYLRGLRATGTTILLTTQYLEEADALADELAIIDRGVLVVAGTPARLKQSLGGDAITVSLHSEADAAAAAALLEGLSDGEAARTYGTTVRIFTSAAASQVAGVVRTLDGAGLEIARLEVAEPTLDDVFLRHTGGRMRVEEVKQPSRLSFLRRRSG